MISNLHFNNGKFIFTPSNFIPRHTTNDGKFWQLINNPDAGSSYYDRDDRTTTTNTDWFELNLANVFSDITYDDTTGVLNIIFSKTTVVGATYDNPGTLVTEYVTGSTIVNSVISLSGLTDVTLTNLQDSQILQYNSGLGQWVNTFGSGDYLIQICMSTVI